MKTIVSWDLAQAVASEAENVDAFIDREVALFGGVNHELAGFTD